jgi:hypothetical protein
MDAPWMPGRLVSDHRHGRRDRRRRGGNQLLGTQGASDLRGPAGRAFCRTMVVDGKRYILAGSLVYEANVEG